MVELSFITSTLVIVADDNDDDDSSAPVVAIGSIAIAILSRKINKLKQVSVSKPLFVNWFRHKGRAKRALQGHVLLSYCLALFPQRWRILTVSNGL